MEPVKKFGQDILWRGKIFHNDIVYIQQQARLLNGEQVQVVSWQPGHPSFGRVFFNVDG